MDKKLGVVVPYRRRYQQLINFKSAIRNYLNSKKIKFEIIIVDQDDAKTFNRGKLLNIGFKYAKKLNCDYVVFHDVDMLPVDVDYSYSDVPIHLATNFEPDGDFTRIIFDDYFGGVTIFPMSAFEEINGYSNEYWGWGYEDTDLLHRCKISGIELDKKEIKMMGGNTAALRFNGNDAYVELKNNINFVEPVTFFVNFYPDDLTLNHEKYDDTYSVFGIPGFDLTVNYNSYSRYNFEMYDANENIMYINSNIKTNYKTSICVTIDPKQKTFSMYQDGELVGTKIFEDRLYNYRRVEKLFLGCTNPNNDVDPKFFKGVITSFAAFNKILTENEIKEISTNQYFALTQPFGDYQSQNNLKMYYDCKFIKDYKLMDLSGNGNDGKIVNCEIVGFTHEDSKIIDVPYRRDSTFRLVRHEENGYVKSAWKDITTRYNQLRYYNEVAKGYRNTKEDGLNNCKYREISNSNLNGETHVVVSI